jgi:hypothetical protein
MGAKKLQLALSTCPSLGWELTWSPKVVEKHNGYRYQVNRRGQTNDKEAERKWSTHFNRILDAEKYLFEFPMSCESQSACNKIEAALTVLDDCKQVDDEGESKKRQVTGINVFKGCKKLQSMSSSNFIRQLGSPNKNPRNHRSFVNGPSKELAGVCHYHYHCHFQCRLQTPVCQNKNNKTLINLLLCLNKKHHVTQ